MKIQGRPKKNEKLRQGDDRKTLEKYFFLEKSRKPSS